MEEKYELAMKTMTIGNLTLKNRIVMPPIATYQSTEDGKVTSKMLEYYGMRATGSNLAMIIKEAVSEALNEEREKYAQEEENRVVRDCVSDFM